MRSTVGHAWLLVLAAAAAAPAAPAEVVSVQTVAGDVLRGVIVRFTVGGGLELAPADGAGVQRVPSEDIVVIAREGQANEPPGPDDVAVELVGGDLLLGRVAPGDGDFLALDTIDAGLVRIPLESVARLRYQARSAATESTPVEATTVDDLVVLHNGDVLRGYVERIAPEAVTVDAGAGPAEIDAELVAQVVFPAQRAPEARGLQVCLLLRSSGRITASDLVWSEPTVEARTPFGAQLRIESQRVLRVEVQGGRWEWLTEHEPISFEHTPMLSLSWPFVRDRNVLGEPLTVAGRSHEHGIGVHSRSRLVYDLRGAYAQFVTSYGLDDRSGPYADVSASVLVDGVPRLESAGIVPGALHGPVRLDVHGARRIELIVDFGRNGDLQDRFNWIDPALVR